MENLFQLMDREPVFEDIEGLFQLLNRLSVSNEPGGSPNTNFVIPVDLSSREVSDPEIYRMILTVKVIYEIFPRFISSIIANDPRFFHLLPLTDDAFQLSDLFDDGLLLCKVISHLFPRSIDMDQLHWPADGRQSLTTEQMKHNLKLCFEATKGHRYPISAEWKTEQWGWAIMFLIELVSEKDSLLTRDLARVLDWTGLVAKGEDKLRKDLLNSKPIEFLLKWCQSLLDKEAYPEKVESLDDLRDIKLYAVIMHQIEPSVCSLTLLETDEHTRLAKIIENATKLGCAEFLSISALLANSDFIRQSFLYRLFFRFSFKEIYPNLDLLEDNGRRFRELLNTWALSGFDFKTSKYDFKGAYEPLKSHQQETRLLCILPSQDHNAPIESSLIHISLKERIGANEGDPIEYAILSYVWGPPELTHTIRVNGKEFHVRANLFQALQAHRDEKFPTWLWVDAICINQHDSAERSNQVSLMADLYRNSDLVFIWLGPEANDAMDLVDLWEKVVIGAEELPDSQGLDSSQYDAQWKAIDELLHREYWSRAWTLQEALLAKNAALVCGRRTAKWYSLMSIIYHHVIPAHPWNEVQWQIANSAAAAITLSIWTFEAQKFAGQKKIPLIDALVLGRTRQATISSDKVFAVLGLIDTTQYTIEVNYEESVSTTFRKTALQAIQTDKNLDILSACKRQFISYEQTYDKRINKYHILKSKNGRWLIGGKVPLSILYPGSHSTSSEWHQVYWEVNTVSQASSPDDIELLDELQPYIKFLTDPVRNPELLEWIEGSLELKDDQLWGKRSWPSWIPDWTHPVSKDEYLFLGHTKIDPKPAIYCAGGTNTPITNSDLPPPLLGVVGLEFDIIERRVIVDSRWEERQEYTPWASYWQGYVALSDIKNPYIDDFGVQKAFGNLMLLGRDSYGNENKSEKPFRMGGLYCDEKIPFQRYNRATRRNGAPVPASHLEPIRMSVSTKEERMKFLGLNETAYDHWYKSQGRIEKLIHWGHGLFITKNGYLGRATYGPKIGDRICVFIGGKTPFALRDAGDGTYHLIGECYVEGIMKGEALKHPHVLKEFKLR